MKVYKNLKIFPSVCLLAFLTAELSLAAPLPRSAVSSITGTIYGMYTTSDASCQADLVATVPLDSKAASMDFVKKVKLGTGPIANPIKCIVIVMKAESKATVAAGSYGNACNAGLTNYDASYQIKDADAQLDWPDKIKTDAATAGLTLLTKGPTTASSVVPIYLSTNSACSSPGVPASAQCTDFPAGHRFPATAGDKTKGFYLASITPSATNEYEFVIDLDKTFDEDGGECQFVNPPLFTFRAK